MGQHAHFHRRRHVEPRAADPDPEPATVVSVVYVTATPTFEGRIGGYTTLGTPVGVPAPSTNEESPAEEPPAEETDEPEPIPDSEEVRPTPAVQAQSSEDEPETIEPASTISSTQSPSPSSSSPSEASGSTGRPSSDSSSELLGTSSTLSSAPSTSLLPTRSVVESASATDGPQPTAAAATSSGGMTGGAKAGLGIGIVFALCAIFGVAFLIWRRRKKAAGGRGYVETEDEKIHSARRDMSQVGARRASSVRTTRTTATAPRLSLRPVTQFDPLPGHNNNNNGTGTLLAGTGNDASGQNGLAVPGAAVTKKSDNVTDPNTRGGAQRNPFGAHAERSNHPAGAAAADGGVAGDRSTAWPSPPSSSHADSESRSAPAAAATAAPSPDFGVGQAVVAAARAATPHSASSSTDAGFATQLTPIPGSPAQSVASSAGTGAVGSVDALAATPVHRVQMDFNPSMDDELGLRVGQLVRVVHEYDDGWALCVRLDRSQQGVAPRTCLSSRPVKPRPTGPAPGHARGPPPLPGWHPPMHGGPDARATPPGTPRHGLRSMSPGPMSLAMGRNSPGPHAALQPRPLSPAGGGRSSPAPYANPGRPASPAGVAYAPAPYVAPPRPLSPATGRNSPGPRAGTLDGSGPSPQRLPTLLRSGSPRSPTSGDGDPSRPSSPGPARKPVPGQAL